MGETRPLISIPIWIQSTPVLNVSDIVVET
jgi:hypothetical protein